MEWVNQCPPLTWSGYSQRWTGEGDGNHGNRLTLLLAVMSHAVLMSVSMAIAWLRNRRLLLQQFLLSQVGEGGVRGGPDAL